MRFSRNNNRRWRNSAAVFLGAGLFLTLSCVSPAIAGPWAEAGDSSLRSDILILASAGVIDDVTMQWPLPWASILDRLSRSSALDDQPAYVRAAAARVKKRGETATRLHRRQRHALLDATSSPGLVRGFADQGRSAISADVAMGYLWDDTAINLSVGGMTSVRGDKQHLVLDDSYVAQRVGAAVVYAGYKTHWWGPGWISALSLSNNARPMPQVGITRAGTDAFESPWLSWIGPWQIEMFVGLLDGPRVATNTAYTAVRFAFSPIPNLEIGLARVTEMCGKGHSCRPLHDYFSILNDDKHINNSNDEGNVDIRYSGSYDGFSYETYVQLMNEDTNPLQHSNTSHLIGASLWLPLDEATGRITVEYTDTVATHDLWGGGAVYGATYNNWIYVNGKYFDAMRYRGRSLGFSMDSDSRMLSVQINYALNTGENYTFSLHHAEVSHALNTMGNAVTSSPVMINMAESRADLPINLNDWNLHVSLIGRVQDDQPRPDKGWLASGEIRLSIDM